MDDLYPVAREAHSYKGKLYGLPTALAVYAMMINLEIFKVVGVEPPKENDGARRRARAQTFFRAAFYLPGVIYAVVVAMV